MLQALFYLALRAVRHEETNRANVPFLLILLPINANKTDSFFHGAKRSGIGKEWEPEIR